jgi:hypothetical protein
MKISFKGRGISPYTISNLTNIMSTVDLLNKNRAIAIGETIQVNDTIIKLQTSTFVHGIGSIISLQVSLKDYYFETEHKYNLSSIKNVLNIKAIYDQGSSELRDFGVNNFLSMPSWVYVFALAYSPITGYLIYYSLVRRRK